MSHDVALGIVGLGTAVIVLSALGALRVGRDPYFALHFVTPITSLGAPLVALGLCIEDGFGLSSGEVLVTTALLFLGAPALQAAVARCIGQSEGRIGDDSPQ